MQSIKSRLKLILRVCIVGFLAVGCCSTHCLDCIPFSKMPYTVYDGGNKYLLMDHLSINQMMNEYELLYATPGLSDNLKKKFSNNQELLAYLDQIDKVHKKIYDSYENEFWGIKADLKRSDGELYNYRMSDKNGKEAEDGWLILSKGKVFEKWTTGTDITGKDY